MVERSCSRFVAWPRFVLSGGCSTALMSHNDAPTGQYYRGDEHKLWLAMQAAYERYTSASEVHDAFPLDISGVIPIQNGSFETHRAIAERQAAFESYIEARLQFSEVFLAGLTTPETRLSSADSVPMRIEDTGGRLRIGLKSKLWVVGVCVLALCSAFLSKLYPIRPRDYQTQKAGTGTRRASQPTQSASAPLVPPRLSVGEHQQGAPTYLARGEIPADAQNEKQLETWHRPVRSEIPPVDLANKAIPERKEQHANSRKRQVQELLPDHRQLHYYPFTLSPSNGYQRTGSLRLSVNSVNLKHRYFDLSILLDGSKLVKKRVRLYQRVRIELGDPGRHAELVASWMGKNRVRGYIIAPKREKSELTAVEPRLKRSSIYPPSQASE